MHRAIPQHAALGGKNAGFCRQETLRYVASQPHPAELSTWHFFAMIEQGSSSRLHSLPDKEFRHAISESDYNPAFRRSARLFGVRHELGWLGASRFLRRNLNQDGIYCLLSAVHRSGFLLSKRR
jgi:hypothetical protein